MASNRVSTKLALTAALALSCVGCTSTPWQEPSNQVAFFQGAIEVVSNDTGDSTLFHTGLTAEDGKPGESRQTETVNIGKPWLVRKGNVTTAKSETATYGFILRITPQLIPGRFPWSEDKVKASIALDHSVALSDGRASHQTPEQVAVLAKGEATELTWDNDGKQYKMVLTLASLYTNQMN